MHRKLQASVLALNFLVVSILTGCGGGSSKTPPASPVIAATSGSSQSAAISMAFSAPLVATVTTSGSPTSGVTVTFTAPSSGASGTFAGGTTTSTATTNSSGVATSAVFTANTATGTYNVTASATGASSANFSLTNVADSIAATSGSAQSAVINAAFSAPLVATVTGGSSPVSGVTVTFTAPSSGASGTFAGGTTTSTATTNSSGVATSAVFTANLTAGTYNVTASATGASSANFSLTNVGESIAVTSGSSQSAVIQAAFGSPLTATVTAGGSAVSGVVVTFTAPSSGASGTFAGGTTTSTATTNSSGVATSAVFTANTTAGTYNVAASATGATAANFSLTNTAGAPASITATSGGAQTAVISTAFSAALTATVKDSFLNPVSGASVTFTAPASGASGTFAGGGTTSTVTTNSSGVATSAAFTANTTLGSYSVTASVSGVVTAASFPLTNAVAGPSTITVTSGSSQSAMYSTAFSAPLVATVLDAGSNPVSGATVIFTAPPTTGASGTFAGGVNTATTNSNGVATSAVFTADATGGAYTVTASVAGVATPASFSLTNTGVNYSFYLSGLENINGGGNFYAVAGAVTLDGAGNVMGGEQDYNDGFGLTSNDSITGGMLTVDPSSGQGTLTLLTNVSLGVAGTETFAVQFVNTKHALIAQFDGSATSSGSLDYQTLSSTIADGNYAFTLTGVAGVNPITVGGVFTISSGGTALIGKYDVDDQGNTPTTILGTTFSGSVIAADSFGRGTVKDTGLASTFAYYIVGPKVIRIINVDPSSSGVPSDSAIGSAFGQGTGTFNNTSLGSSVFGIQSNSQFSTSQYAAAGQFKVPVSGSISGVADDNEVQTGPVHSQAGISGTYSIASSGYGSMAISPGSLGNISILGIYMTDPTLNLNDPNNTTTGLGGALIADLDTVVSGTGMLVPQTDATAASFTGNYAFGAQDFYSTSSDPADEFDFVGTGSVAGHVFGGTGLVSDPSDLFSGTTGGADSLVGFSGTATPDNSYLGRYTLPLLVNTGGCTTQTLKLAIYQASGNELFWVDYQDNTAAFSSGLLGFMEKKGSLTGIPTVMRKATKKKASQVVPDC